MGWGGGGLSHRAHRAYANSSNSYTSPPRAGNPNPCQSAFPCQKRLSWPNITKRGLNVAQASFLLRTAPPPQLNKTDTLVNPTNTSPSLTVLIAPKSPQHADTHTPLFTRSAQRPQALMFRTETRLLFPRTYTAKQKAPLHAHRNPTAVAHLRFSVKVMARQCEGKISAPAVSLRSSRYTTKRKTRPSPS